MSEISTLSPKLLWQWFDQICAIPHPSYHEEALATYIIDWAKKQSLFVERDEVGNILIRKPATQGMENHQAISLQAHLDMVPQANEGTVHDFTQDPIQPYIDGEWVKAKGTTLGADNGIGLASCMAVLEATDLAHPDLEVLLTMTEERGMEGALGLQPHWLKSNIMINTDTEENGEIYIGCAGGINANLLLPITLEENHFDCALQLTLKGLRGGHSGCDIHTGRANAIKLLMRALAELQAKVPVQLAQVRGGSVRNAIPREASADIVFNSAHQKEILQFITQFEQTLKAELAVAEPNFTLFTSNIAKPTQIFTAIASQKTILLFNALPNGVIRYSDTVTDTVETSLSIGVLSLKDNVIKGTILIRSLTETGKEDVARTLDSLAQLAGAQAEFAGDYPGWNPEPSSTITALTKTIYDSILGYESKIKVIHAGLECGLIKKIYPNMDLVSIGPTILNAHSPDEKVNIAAVQTYWQLLTEILANSPKQ